MAYLLHLETCTDVCSAALSKDEQILALRESKERNEHAALLVNFVSELVLECGVPLSKIDAISVGKGPGSYTGLRIGISTAKGLCYALDKPLIAINPLLAMALHAISIYKQTENWDSQSLFCPMTDAGRMEVYTGLYDINGTKIEAVDARIIDTNSYLEILDKRKIYFFGNGASKCMEVLSIHRNALFLSGILNSAAYMTSLANEAYKKADFVSLAYFEPFYLKNFIAGKPTVKGLHP